MRYALFTNYAYHDQMSLIEQYSHVLFTPLTLQLFQVEGFFALWLNAKKRLHDTSAFLNNR